jgi:hypothetical protein
LNNLLNVVLDSLLKISKLVLYLMLLRSFTFLNFYQFNGYFDVGLLKFRLVIQISEKIDVVYIKIVDEFELKFKVIYCM